MFKQFFNKLFLLIIAGTCCFSSTSGQEVASKVDAYMEAQMKVNHFSGTIFIAQNGKILLSKGYGMADNDARIANASQTVFRLGSITKQFTATAIMLLQEKGKLHVQYPICKYLADCPQTWKAVTIHHLLTHTSGIPSYTGFPEFKQTMNQPITPVELIGLFKNKPLEFTPGEKFNYSNSGYILLGYIIEKASGKSYENYLKENIFTPLAMKNTGYERTNDGVKKRATGYTLDGGNVINALPLDMSRPYAAGALYSTVEDLYLWDQALYTEKILSQKSLSAMFTPDKQSYGYGWGISELFGKKIIAHNGGINGFATNFSRFPESKTTVVVLSNQETTNAAKVGSDLSAIVFNETYEIPKMRTATEIDSKVYDLYAGAYQLTPDFVITITKEDDKLLAQATGQSKFEIYPESQTKFFYKVVDAQVSFVKDDKGQISHLILHQNGQEMLGKKIK